MLEQLCQLLPNQPQDYCLESVYYSKNKRVKPEEHVVSQESSETERPF